MSTLAMQVTNNWIDSVKLIATVQLTAVSMIIANLVPIVDSEYLYREMSRYQVLPHHLE